MVADRALDVPPTLAPEPPGGLYIHVPFCISLCPYCDFVVYTGRAARGPSSRGPAFLAALHVEIDLRADELDERFGPPGADRPTLGSVYLGGGTPSLLPAAAVGDLLGHVSARFGIAADAEVTLEANPGPTELGDLDGFRAAGVTRLSLGVQSMDRAALRSIGRRHEPADVATAVARGRAAGFASIGLDLLTDLPGQSVAAWASTLGAAIALEPDHLSIYALTLGDPEADGVAGVEGDHLPVRRGARRWRERARGGQDDDRAAAMEALADERCAASGYERYEIANLARPGHRSRHNLRYWHRSAWAALGPGAHACDGALERRWTGARLDRYLAALLPETGPARLPPGGLEALTPDDVVIERAILGLRLAEGIGAALATSQLVAPALRWARTNGLAEEVPDSGAVRLTARGRLLANEVFARVGPP